MIHLGDITKINGAEIEPVDCITAGSPCQDLSVAGKRAGLEGERSGLFMEQIRIIKEMREHDRNNGRADEFVRPRYMVWENVPGAFSSNKGEDFRCVLEETAKVAERDAVIPGPPKGKWSKSGAIMGDGWSIAWRVHDAQFWGVPQRRKRIALVADFGGESAPEILFERKSLSGDIATSGKERQGIAENASGSVGEAGATFYDAYQHHGWRESDTSGTLTAGQNNSVRGDTPLIAEDMKAIVEPIPINTMVCTRTTDENRTTFGIGSSGDPQFTLSSAHSHAVAVENHPQDSSVKTYAIQRNDEYKESDLAHTQAARDYKSATDLVVSAVDCRNMNESDVSGTLQSKDNGGYSLNYTNPIRMNSIVRRLTPLECERLQGFPDGWTDIGEWTDTKGKVHKESSDSARYKALGNSIALPFWFYLLRRISAQYERPATLGSLFDGIGGFPLCWERCNGSGTARWASEIEEFPIAVTKKRFGE